MRKRIYFKNALVVCCHTFGMTYRIFQYVKRYSSLELIDDNKRSLSARRHDVVKKLSDYRIVRHIFEIRTAKHPQHGPGRYLLIQ